MSDTSHSPRQRRGRAPSRPRLPAPVYPLISLAVLIGLWQAAIVLFAQKRRLSRVAKESQG